MRLLRARPCWRCAAAGGNAWRRPSAVLVGRDRRHRPLSVRSPGPISPGPSTRFLMFGRTNRVASASSPRAAWGPRARPAGRLIGIALCLASVARTRSRPRRAAHSDRRCSRFGVAHALDHRLPLPLRTRSTRCRILTVIALQTATFIVAVSLGVIASVPEHPPMRWLAGPWRHRRRRPPRRPWSSSLLPILLGWLAPAGTARRPLRPAHRRPATLVLGPDRRPPRDALAGPRDDLPRTKPRLTPQRARDCEEADRRKSEFIAILAHELRNPLAPISERGADPLNPVEGVGVGHGAARARALIAAAGGPDGPARRPADGRVAPHPGAQRAHRPQAARSARLSIVVHHALDGARPLISSMRTSTSMWRRLPEGEPALRGEPTWPGCHRRS